VQSW